MLTIQEVGKQIMLNEPGKFYVFAGSEYGIKSKYIQTLHKHYGEIKNCDTVESVLKFMSTKHLFPPKPAVYVVRYDESFIRDLDENTQSEIDKCNIIGTVVCIYDNPKHEAKLEKWLPNYSLHVPPVDKKFVYKYLKNDFPNVPDELINCAAKIGNDYMQSQLIVECMAMCPVEDMIGCTPDQIKSLFGVNDMSEDEQVKIGTASRNFRYLVGVVDKYPDHLDRILYAMLSTMIELEKLTYNKYLESNIREYTKLWTLEDIYNMYNHIYNELNQIRSIGKSSEDSICYLAALLQFRPIPECMEKTWNFYANNM